MHDSYRYFSNFMVGIFPKNLISVKTIFKLYILKLNRNLLSWICEWYIFLSKFTKLPSELKNFEPSLVWHFNSLLFQLIQKSSVIYFYLNKHTYKYIIHPHTHVLKRIHICIYSHKGAQYSPWKTHHWRLNYSIKLFSIFYNLLLQIWRTETNN